MSRKQQSSILAIVAALLVAATVVVIGQSVDGTEEVRINARRLDDGRIEFALQQRSDGSWSERILPRARKLPVDSEVGRWLNSSPVAIDVGTESEVRLDSEGPILREEGYIDYDDGRYFTNVRMNTDETGASWMSSTLWIKADAYRYEDIDSAVWLAIRCEAGQRIAEIHQLRLEPARGANYFYNAHYGVSPPTADGFTNAPNLRWDTYERYREDGTWTVNIRLDTPFYLHIRSASNLVIRLVGNGVSEDLTFSLDGYWETSIQPNLDRCGDYYQIAIERS